MPASSEDSSDEDGSDDIEWQQQRQRQHQQRAVVLAAMATVEVYSISSEKQPYHTSLLTGQHWLIELLTSPNPHRLKEQLGLQRHVYLALVSQLTDLAGLRDSRQVSAHEQVAIFLYTVTGNASIRKVAERFQHSTQTVSNYVSNVSNALVSPQFYSKYVKLPSNTVPPKISENPKFYPFFQDVLAAIDGSHVNAMPASEDRVRYRNHKGGVSQNVLLSCTFDMRFCHVLSGWEGSASDAALFNDARKHDLMIPPGKCYLADAGFPSCDALLVPYRGVRYHLKEWGKANVRYVLDIDSV
jgi:hypothetical protein